MNLGEKTVEHYVVRHPDMIILSNKQIGVCRSSLNDVDVQDMYIFKYISSSCSQVSRVDMTAYHLHV